MISFSFGENSVEDEFSGILSADFTDSSIRTGAVLTGSSFMSMTKLSFFSSDICPVSVSGIFLFSRTSVFCDRGFKST